MEIQFNGAFISPSVSSDLSAELFKSFTHLPPMFQFPADAGTIRLDAPKLNTRDEILSKNEARLSREDVHKRTGEAMARRLPSFIECGNIAREWAVIGGGPSINDNIQAIRRLKRQGVNIVSVNKSHDWLLEHGIVPWGHVLLDPQERVAGYVTRPRKDVRYFIASQCHEGVFEALNDYPVFLFHAGQDFPHGPEPTTYLKEHHSHEQWYVIPGPTTVGLRTVNLGHAMNADKFHLFGLDGSRKAGKMHAYDKAEVDAGSGSLAIKHNGKKYRFDTNTHMVRQQMDFDKIIEELPIHLASGKWRKGFSMTVYGSGILPFFAATIGLHADPKCNDNPELVGGWIGEPERIAA